MIATFTVSYNFRGASGWMLHAVLCFCCVSYTVVAQPPVSVAVQLDSSGYRVGDYIGLTVIVSHPYDISPALSDVSRRLGNQFEMIGEEKSETIEQAKFLTEQKKFLITTFDSGWLRIPPLVAYYKTPAGKWDSASSDPLPVYVAAVPVDISAAPRPIKSLIQNQAKPLWPWISGAFLAAGLAGIFLWLRIRSGKNKIKSASLTRAGTPGSA